MVNVSIQDCRNYDARAVEIANLLGSRSTQDYRKVEAWLKGRGEYQSFKLDTLVELFAREVGLTPEAGA